MIGLIDAQHESVKMSVIVTMTETIPDREISEVLGTVQGNVVRARNIGLDLVAVLRLVVGGEVSEYTKLMSAAREQAMDRMEEHAKSLGADAVVSMRITTSTIMQGAAEILVYGTAVRLK